MSTGSDWVCLAVIIVIGVLLLVVGMKAPKDNLVTNLLEGTDISLVNAYQNIVMAGKISYYTGIALLVISALALIILLVPNKINPSVRRLMKFIIGTGIVIISIVIAAAFLTKAYSEIKNSAIYKASVLEGRKLFDQLLSYIQIAIYSFYGLAIVTALIFIGLAVYDSKKSDINVDEVEVIEEKE